MCIFRAVGSVVLEVIEEVAEDGDVTRMRYQDLDPGEEFYAEVRDETEGTVFLTLDGGGMTAAPIEALELVELDWCDCRQFTSVRGAPDRR